MTQVQHGRELPDATFRGLLCFLLNIRILDTLESLWLLPPNSDPSCHFFLKISASPSFYRHHCCPCSRVSISFLGDSVLPSLQPAPTFKVLEEWFSLNTRPAPLPPPLKTLSCNPLAAELSPSPLEQVLSSVLVTYYFCTPKSSRPTYTNLSQVLTLPLLFPVLFQSGNP